MKLFIITNWYKLTIATAMMVFACAFMTFVIKNNEAKAGIPNSQIAPSPTNTWMAVKGNTVYEVTRDRYSHEYKCNPVCDAN